MFLQSIEQNLEFLLCGLNDLSHMGQTLLSNFLTLMLAVDLVEHDGLQYNAGLRFSSYSLTSKLVPHDWQLRATLRLLTDCAHV